MNHSNQSSETSSLTASDKKATEAAIDRWSQAINRNYYSDLVESESDETSKKGDEDDEQTDFLRWLPDAEEKHIEDDEFNTRWKVLPPTEVAAETNANAVEMNKNFDADSNHLNKATKEQKTSREAPPDAAALGNSNSALLKRWLAHICQTPLTMKDHTDEKEEVPFRDQHSANSVDVSESIIIPKNVVEIFVDEGNDLDEIVIVHEEDEEQQRGEKRKIMATEGFRRSSNAENQRCYKQLSGQQNHNKNDRVQHVQFDDTEEEEEDATAMCLGDLHDRKMLASGKQETVKNRSILLERLRKKCHIRERRKQKRKRKQQKQNQWQLKSNKEHPIEEG